MWNRIYIALFAFTESANFFFIKTILVLYFYGWLDYDKNGSSILFHGFLTLVAISPLLGAFFADKWLYKFNTIFGLSLIRAVGCIILMLASLSTVDNPRVAIPRMAPSLVALFFIALCVGGISTCLFSLTRDQFKLPKQAKVFRIYLLFVSFLVFCGSMLPTGIAPGIRELFCNSNEGCFSLVFALSAIFMIAASVIFIIGKKKYKTKPRGDIFSPMNGSINKNIFKSIVFLYLPLSFFWALFDQQGSRWTLQATRMDGEMLGYNVKPDQMQLSYYLLLIILMPVIQYTIYPLFKLLALKTPLRKIFVGGLFAAAAFISAAYLEMDLEKLDPVSLNSTTALIRVYNGLNCEVKLYPFPSIFEKKKLTVENLGMYEVFGYESHLDKTMPQSRFFLWPYLFATLPTPRPTKKKPIPPTPEEFVCRTFTTNEHVVMGKAQSYFFHQGSAELFEEQLEKPKLGLPIVRPLINAPKAITVALKDSDGYVTTFAPYSTNAITVARGEVTLIAHDLPRKTIMTRTGGVYVILANRNRTNTEVYNVQTYETVEHNNISMIWQLPQYVFITVAEIMVTGSVQKFTNSEAPLKMQPILQGSWWLTRAIGNILAMSIMAINFFESQSNEYILFAVLMVVAMIIFLVLAAFYKKVERDTTSPDADDDDDDDIPPNPDQNLQLSPKASKKSSKHHSNATDNKSDKPKKSHKKRRESATVEIPPLTPTNPKPQSRHSKSTNKQRPTKPTVPTVHYSSSKAPKPTSSQSRSAKSSSKATSRSQPPRPSTSASARPEASSKRASRPPSTKTSSHHRKRTPE